MMPVNVIQHRWTVGNFSSHFNFHKLKSKSDSLLGICWFIKKISHVLMLYILSHVVSGLLAFSDGLKTGIFQSTPSSYLIRLRGFMNFFCKRGGVCFYHRNSLPLKILDIFYLQECIVFELKIGNTFCKII